MTPPNPTNATPECDAAAFEIIGHLQSGTEKVVHIEVARSLETRLRAAEGEIERARDELADFDREMLRKFDPAAAESTDLFTWIKCVLASRDQARATIATLTSQLAEAQRLLHRAYPYIEDAQADATSDESLLAIRTLLSDIDAAMKDTHGNA